MKFVTIYSIHMVMEIKEYDVRAHGHGMVVMIDTFSVIR